MKTRKLVCNKSLLQSQLRDLGKAAERVIDHAKRLEKAMENEMSGVSVDWRYRTDDSRSVVLAYITIFQTAAFRLQEFVNAANLEVEPLTLQDTLKHCT